MEVRNYENIKYCGEHYGNDVLRRSYFDFIEEEGRGMKIEKWRGKILWNGRLADEAWKGSVILFAKMSGLNIKGKNGKIIPQFYRFWEYIADNMMPIQLAKERVRRLHIFYISAIVTLIIAYCRLFFQFY